MMAVAVNHVVIEDRSSVAEISFQDGVATAVSAMSGGTVLTSINDYDARVTRRSAWSLRGIYFLGELNVPPSFIGLLDCARNFIEWVGFSNIESNC